MFSGYLGFSNQLKEYQPYVSQSPSPTGVKAIYTYLENERDSVSSWSNEPSLLSKTEENQLLIMVEPSFIPTEEDMRAYKEFINAGNTILLFSEDPVGMFDIKTNFVESELLEETRIKSEDNSTYQAVVTSPIRIKTNDEDSILLSDDFGANAVKRSFGEGELIVSNSPQWVMNGNILEADHFPLVMSLVNEEANDKNILFDEYIHGASPTFLTVYPKAFLVLMLQLAFLTILWLWYKGKRFGPVLLAREEFVRFSDESIKALAAWYLRMKGSRFHDSLMIQADYTKLLMQERWGIAQNSEWEDISPQLKRRWKSMPANEIDSFLKDLKNVLEKEGLSKQEYLLWSKKLDRLRRGVEEE